jgi:hypothetical protein
LTGFGIRAIRVLPSPEAHIHTRPDAHMKPKTSALNRLKDTARLLKEQAGRVCLHITSKRVTHTVSSLKRLIALVTDIQKGLQDDREFFKRAEFALYQCQHGPTEIRFEKQEFKRTDEKEYKTVMFIQGSFDIAMLKEFFVVNEPEGMTTISVEGPNVTIKKEFEAWSEEG